MAAKKTIRIFLLLIAFMSVAQMVYSQKKGSSKDANLPSLSFSAGHYRYDPGVGIETYFPLTSKNRLGLRMKANLQWLEEYKAATHHWASYETYWSGVVFNTSMMERGRVYFELGLFAIVPNNAFSEVTFGIGTYEAVGAELFFLNGNNNVCLYFSVGGAHIRAHAERLEGSPRYGNGIVLTNGFRYYFRNRNPQSKIEPLLVHKAAHNTQ